MLFNSPVYIFLFLPIVFVVYFYLNKIRLINGGKAWLVLSSLFFYGYWNSSYLLIIISSILVNFSIGSALEKKGSNSNKPTNRLSNRSLLVAGIAFNLGLLAYFKYADFFLGNVNGLLGTHFPALNLLLPLAISFFTFQQIAYLVDSYKGIAKEYDFLNYCLFVTFFPQLIAGPIVHHKEMMPQFVRLRNKVININNLSLGLFIFSLGLFKKVFIADTFAQWVNIGFDAEGAIFFWEAWRTSLSYTFQIYYDFSGYTDMAIGAALMFNVKLPINFNSPYKSLSIQDFWRRWHITLSNWLKDYLYIPLGGNRKGYFRTYVNLIVTFILGGLWHGAGWTFLIWGLMHGVALAIHRLWKTMGYKLNAVTAWIVTFFFVNIAWVFFRAETFGSATRILNGMIDISSAENSLDAYAGIPVYFTILFAAVAFFLPNTIEIIKLKNYSGHLSFKPNVAYGFVGGVSAAVGITYMLMVESTEFLYFNF